jgi:hypothetical protein
MKKKQVPGRVWQLARSQKVTLPPVLPHLVTFNESDIVAFTIKEA